MKAVIQAGGKGTRLQPHTLVLPKPLMPVGSWPVIELLLKWLRRNGVYHTYIAIGHLGHLIKSVCKDGSQWDMKIEYSEEKEPLGTVGPLNLIGREKLNKSFLMLNGDLITDLDLREFIDCHRQNKGLVTIAITEKNVQVDMGVLDVRDGQMVRFREKPMMNFKVSMGIYCIEPDILDLIPKGIPFGFDNLMHIMLEKNLPVNVYEHNGLWMDIGRPEDFIKAQKTFSENHTSFTGIY
jgi:mannose-1-phosphate guanylyltransferase